MPSISQLSSSDPSYAVVATVNSTYDWNKLNALQKACNDADAFVNEVIHINSEFIDLVITRLESVLEKLEAQQEEQQLFDFDHSVIFQEFKDTLRDDFTDFNSCYLLAEQNVNFCMEGIRQGIYCCEADSYHHYINDCYKDKVNEMITVHLYRIGLIDVADLFVKEAGVKELTDQVTGLGLRLQFSKLQDVTNAVKNFETELPLQWITDNRERLGETKASELEYKIHVNKYLRMVEESGSSFRIHLKLEALNYAKVHIARFYNEHNTNEIHMLTGCALYSSYKLRFVANSRYCHLFDGSYQQTLIAEIREQFFILMGQCVTDPLSTVISVGAKFLHAVCAAAKLDKEYHGCEWGELRDLPLYLNLNEDVKFHSYFACPFLKVNMENGFNPPVALLCNHVLSFKAMHYNSVYGTIVCPLCHAFTENLGYKTVYF